MEPVLLNSKMELGTHFVFHDGTILQSSKIGMLNQL